MVVMLQIHAQQNLTWTNTTYTDISTLEEKQNVRCSHLLFEELPENPDHIICSLSMDFSDSWRSQWGEAFSWMKSPERRPWEEVMSHSSIFRFVLIYQMFGEETCRISHITFLLMKHCISERLFVFVGQRQGAALLKRMERLYWTCQWKRSNVPPARCLCAPSVPSAGWSVRDALVCVLNFLRSSKGRGEKGFCEDCCSGRVGRLAFLPHKHCILDT